MSINTPVIKYRYLYMYIPYVFVLIPVVVCTAPRTACCIFGNQSVSVYKEIIGCKVVETTGHLYRATRNFVISVLMELWNIDIDLSAP